MRPAPAGGAALAPRWLRLAPIVAFELYLNLSIALFAFGPWVWPLADPTRLFIFVGLAHAAILAGYLSALRARPRGYYGQLRPRTLLSLSVALTLLLYLPTMLSINGGVIDPVGAIRDPGATYYRFQAVNAAAGGERGVALLTYVRMLAAPLLALLMPLLARLWPTLPRTARVLGVVAVLSNVSLFVFTGRNKGLLDIVLILPWLLAIYAVAGGGRVRRGRLAAGAALFVVILLFFGDFFSRGNLSRQGDVSVAFESVSLFGGLRADLDNPLVRDLPPQSKGVVLGLTFTQTHGYYALALALDKPFEPAWGVGHSYFLAHMEERITGRTELGDRSYPARLQAENGWSITEFWHTTYTWLASDVSFPGTIVLMFVFGRLLALAWSDTLRGDNPYAAGFLIVLVTMAYYLPTNNIVLGFAEGMASFWGLLWLWTFTRRPVRLRAAVPAHAPLPPAGAFRA